MSFGASWTYALSSGKKIAFDNNIVTSFKSVDERNLTFCTELNFD